VLILVPNQIIDTLELKQQHIYAEQRIKTPFAPNDEIRLFSKSNLSVLNMVYKHDAATEDIRV
jgi:hypothetical protein